MGGGEAPAEQQRSCRGRCAGSSCRAECDMCTCAVAQACAVQPAVAATSAPDQEHRKACSQDRCRQDQAHDQQQLACGARASKAHQGATDQTCRRGQCCITHGAGLALNSSAQTPPAASVMRMSCSCGSTGSGWLVAEMLADGSPVTQRRIALCTWSQGGGGLMQGR